LTGPTPVVYFDLDGTLLDVRPRYYALHSHIAGLLGLPPGASEAFWHLKRARAPTSELLAGLPPGDIETYDRLWLELIEDSAFTRLDRALPGALEALGCLDTLSEPVLLTLRRDGGEVRRQLRELSFEHFFREVLVSGDHPALQRSKRSLVRLSDRVRRRDALLVGDTEEDAAAAQSLDIPFIAVSSGLRDSALLQEMKPYRIIESVATLPEVFRSLYSVATERRLT